MIRARKLLVVSLAATASVISIGALRGAKADTPGSVGDSAEAWYDSSQATICSSPVGCPPITLPTDSYPANTLHIGVTAGNETARTYLMPDLSSYLGGPLPVSGTMTLPLATASGNGNSNDSAATIEACLATGVFPDGAHGSTSSPPAVQCAVHSALHYATTSFTLDLGPFLSAWSSGAPQYGIALIPDSSQTGPTSVWHVAFNGRKLSDAPHISSTFAPVDASTATTIAPVATITPPVSTPAVNAPAISAPPSVTPPAAVTQSPSVAALPTTTLPAPAPASNQQFEPAVATGGFQYPEIMAFPLVLGAVMVFVLRLLMSDATPKYLRSRRP